MKRITPILLFLMLLTFTVVEAQHQIIPAPRSYEATDGELVIEDGLEIFLLSENDKIKQQVTLFGTQMKGSGVGMTVVSAENPAAKTLKIGLNESAVDTLGTEGYQLLVDESGMTLMANTPAGTFNGLQTIKQLLPVKRTVSEEGDALPVHISACKIEDAPRFGWRGLMLDVSRHFFTVDEVKAYLDQMAEFKFNVFHWHLTDDQGWRIEIKTFPKLTEVGAWRVERHGRFGSERAAPKKGEKTTYGGFYTQEEIKDVIAYASERNITIVPEIDVP